ncbi:MAG: Zn-ribbon protein [Sphingomonadales bacterium]|nr:Zn-ribbon protein [Sphingomonadales bacterium]
MTSRLFICPNCKQKKGVNIRYGYPGEDLREQAERNEVILGGCARTIGEPDRQCLDCDHQWEIVRRGSRGWDEITGIEDRPRVNLPGHYPHNQP